MNETAYADYLSPCQVFKPDQILSIDSIQNKKAFQNDHWKRAFSAWAQSITTNKVVICANGKRHTDKYTNSIKRQINFLVILTNYAFCIRLFPSRKHISYPTIVIVACYTFSLIAKKHKVVDHNGAA